MLLRGELQINEINSNFEKFECALLYKINEYAFNLIIFHKAIAFNDFLLKINRKNSPNCDFCDKFPESIIHIFCECDFDRPIWEEVLKIIKDKYDVDFTVSNFDKIFGVLGASS